MEACADGPGDDYTDSPTKITLERDQAIHSCEQLKKEHIGLRQSFERMYSQALALQRVRYNVLCDQ